MILFEGAVRQAMGKRIFVGWLDARGGSKRELLRNKNKGPARRISCKPLICLVPEPGIEPGRPYERGILSPRINPYISVVCEFLRSAVSQL